MSITLHKNSQLKTIPPVQQLGFGLHFSDHMLTSHYREGQGWFDTKIEPLAPLPIHPAAAVLHYGQALFEGMKAFRQHNGRVVMFRPEFNYHRLVAGAERLCLPPPPGEVFVEGIRELVRTDERWVPSSLSSALYIRPTLLGTEAFLGVRPSKEALFFTICSPVANYYGDGSKPIRILVEEAAVRAAPGGLGATKAGANYAASLKSAHEARANGFSQVLWLNVDHQAIEEVGTMNIFFVFKNEIVTPALNGSILAGGVRDCAITWLRDLGHLVHERRITISEVIERLQGGELLEIFGTGTAAVITPVGVLRYRETDWVIHGDHQGPVASKLRNDLTEIQRGTQPDPYHWVWPV